MEGLGKNKGGGLRGIDTLMHTMDKMGGQGILRNGGMILKWGGVDTPLKTMLFVLSKTVGNENFN